MSLEQQIAHEASPSLDISSYLTRREQAPNFVTVEIGHREKPVVTNMNNLTGQRAYIGVEAWIRDPLNIVRPRIQALAKELVAQNVFFIDQPLAGTAAYFEGDGKEKSSAAFKGEYDPETILPDDSADEIILSNVFGDPHISNYEKYTKKLLSETSRLLAPGGKIIIRETITPWHVTQLHNENLDDVNLKKVGHIKVGSTEWGELEDVFNGSNDLHYDPHGSFYLVLEKADA